MDDKDAFGVDLDEVFGTLVGETDEEERQLDIDFGLRLLYSRSGTNRERGLSYLYSKDSKLTLLAARAGVSDSSPLVRGESIDILAEIGNQQDIPRLIAALDDKKWEVRSSAAVALGDLRNAAAGAALVARYAKERDQIVRRDIALSLPQYGDAYAETLQTLLKQERTPLVRVGLLWAVYVTHPQSDLRDYLKLLQHDDFLVRNNVVNAIQPEQLRKSDCDFLIKSLIECSEQETNTGNLGDAQNKIDEIKESCSIQMVE